MHADRRQKKKDVEREVKPLDLDHTNQSWFWPACWGQLLGLVPVPVPELVLAPMLGAVLVLVPDPVLALVVTKIKKLASRLSGPASGKV